MDPQRRKSNARRRRRRRRAAARQRRHWRPTRRGPGFGAGLGAPQHASGALQAEAKTAAAGELEGGPAAGLPAPTVYALYMCDFHDQGSVVVSTDPHHSARHPHCRPDCDPSWLGWFDRSGGWHCAHGAATVRDCASVRRRVDLCEWPIRWYADEAYDEAGRTVVLPDTILEQLKGDEGDEGDEDDGGDGGDGRDEAGQSTDRPTGAEAR